MLPVDWSDPVNLNKLLTCTDEELQSNYPTHTLEGLKRTRRKYKEKIRKGLIIMPALPHNPEQEPSARWEAAAFDKEKGEWVHTELRSWRNDRTRSVDDLFPQIEPSVIHPTKRKRAQKLGERILSYGDNQVDFRIIRDPRTLETEVLPLQNLPQSRIILRMNAYYMPPLTVNGGDMPDFAGSSRFPADSDNFDGSMTLAMRWIHDFYAQMVADNPNAKHVEVASNNADRPRKKVLNVAREFYNFYRPGEDYPAWTYYSMARLGELGIIHPTGYPHGEYIYGDPNYPQILFKHGSITGRNAVYREADLNPTMNVVRFHNHGERMIKRTTREGRQLFYLILGSSCLNGSNVPGYHSAVDDFNRPVEYHNQDHVNSFVMIRDYGGGRFEPVTIDVVDGKAYYDGMEWDGNEPYEWEYKYGYIKEDS